MRFISLAGLALIGVGLAAPVDAQPRPDIFADPENLKVLPKNISSDELRETMRGFALGLGVRCSHCHVGEDGQPLSSFKFPSDEKPTKRIARAMLEMVGSINGRVGKILDGADHDPVAVRCVTCHRGRNRPLLLVDVLTGAVTRGGAEAAVAEYRALRDKYYGGHAFDFSAFGLGEVANKLLARDQPEASIALHRLNVEYYPDDAMARVNLGAAHQRLGERQPAMENYRQALDLNPGLGFVKRRLKALEQKPE